MDDRVESSDSHREAVDVPTVPSATSPPLASWPELEALIGPGGRLAEVLPGYERRQGQETMMRAVAGAIERSGTLLVEAGTGTGKSLAYLLPAALSGEQVILSTQTKTLQDQLLREQVPFVRETLGVDLVATVLKGRSNYLCLHQLDVASKTPSMALDQHTELGHLQRWAETTNTGDRAELVDLPDDSPLWRKVTTDAEQCLARRCPFFDACFVMLARRRADAADLVIVNHYLFFADLALRSTSGFGLLPDAQTVVFDEAHHIEDIAASYFGSAVSDVRIRRLGGDARRLIRSLDLDAAQITKTEHTLSRDVDRLFDTYEDLLPQSRLTQGSVTETRRVAYQKLDNTLLQLSQHIAGIDGNDEGLARLVLRAALVRQDLGDLVECRSRDQVYWVEQGTRATFLRAAPIAIGDRLAATLFDRYSTVILTSATLTTGGDFSHIRSRLGLPPSHATELKVSSPFDYPRQAALYTPQDLPHPSSDAYTDAIAETMATLVDITQGRALLLFTSFRQLRAVHERLRDRLKFPILVQGDGSKETLLARLKQTAGTVLFATATFWEGVDVVGDALSLVVIDKLPFAPPGDPVVEARIALLSDAGENAFMRYQVPQASIALKQGVGRLIRHQDDRGIVAILDPRLTKARYGKYFLESLPPMTRIQGLDALRTWWAQHDATPPPTLEPPTSESHPSSDTTSTD
ncbi:MAG: ATP-dependent DNA helicase DinG [Myxococcota bacterium]